VRVEGAGTEGVVSAPVGEDDLRFIAIVSPKTGAAVVNELRALRSVAEAAKAFSDCVAADDTANVIRLGIALDDTLRAAGRIP